MPRSSRVRVQGPTACPVARRRCPFGGWAPDFQISYEHRSSGPASRPTAIHMTVGSVHACIYNRSQPAGALHKVQRVRSPPLVSSLRAAASARACLRSRACHPCRPGARLSIGLTSSARRRPYAYKLRGEAHPCRPRSRCVRARAPHAAHVAPLVRHEGLASLRCRPRRTSPHTPASAYLATRAKCR